MLYDIPCNIVLILYKMSVKWLIEGDMKGLLDNIYIP